MVSINPIRAISKLQNSKRTDELSQFNIDRSDAQLDRQKENTRQSLRTLGKSKSACFTETLPKLVNVLEQIQCKSAVEYTFGNKTVKWIPVQISPELERSCSIAGSIASGALTGVTGGALTAFAVYSGVAAFGTASTGTAIAALSGQAAINATLAWFGGGSIAAGGLGMKRGLQILGGAAVVVGVVILGIQLNAKADKAEAESETGWIKSLEYEDKQKILIERMMQLEKIAKLANKTIKHISSLALDESTRIESYLQQYGNNFQEFPQNVQESFYRGTVFVDLLNRFSKISILDDTGAPDANSENHILEISSSMQEITAGGE